MALHRARQMELARAQFASLMADSPPNLGPVRRNSYKDSLLSPSKAIPSSAAPIRTREAQIQHIRNKIEEIRRSSTLSRPVCMRCGMKGHLAVACRDPPICFICNKTGHKGISCHSVSVTSPPIPSTQATHKSKEAQTMAPPAHRRGFPRSWPYHPGGRASHGRPPGPGIDPLIHPSTDGHPPLERHSHAPRPPIPPHFRPQPQPFRPPLPMAQRMPPVQQTPPDRPIQSRDTRPTEPVRPRVVEPAVEPPIQRSVHPPILMFNSTPESEAIDRELQLSFLLDDIAGWGPEKVERLLRFSYPPFLWVVQVLDEFVYLIQAPSDEWAHSATRKKWIRMEDIQFPILKWDPSFNVGKRLQSVWIRLTGFPYNLWEWGEFNSLVSPFGAIVLELDPGTRSRNTNGFVATYDLEFEIETDQTESIHAWRGRLNGRPYPNGTPFGVKPQVPVPQFSATNQSVTNPPEPVSHPTNPEDMDEDLLDPNPGSTTIPPRDTFSEHGPPVSSIYQPPPYHTTRPTPPFRHVLHGPSPQPPRQRGVVIAEPSPRARPMLGKSPPGKGKKPLSASKCSDEINKLGDGYETSDSDEDSFENALNAILHMDKGLGLGSTSAAPQQGDQSDPPADSGTAQQPTAAEIPYANSSSENKMVAHSPLHYVPLETDLTIQNPDSDSDLLGDGLDHLLDEEPLSVRAKRLQVQKEKSKNLQPKTPPPKSKKADHTKPPNSIRFSPAVATRTITLRRQSVSPARRTKQHHRPRSRTKKPVNSASPSSVDKTVTESLAMSTDYVTTPEVNLESYHRKYLIPVLRRSVRLQVNTTQTPIMKRAQKRKANGSHIHKGSNKVPQQTKEATQDWMPQAGVLETIPLRVWLPGDDQLMPQEEEDFTTFTPPPSTSPSPA